jgi:hypothetical protein
LSVNVGELSAESAWQKAKTAITRQLPHELGIVNLEFGIDRRLGFNSEFQIPNSQFPIHGQATEALVFSALSTA